jgi:hypothetical protein
MQGVIVFETTCQIYIHPKWIAIIRESFARLYS